MTSSSRFSSFQADHRFNRTHAAWTLGVTVVALAIDRPALATWAGAASLGRWYLLHRGHFTPHGAFGLANTVTTLRLGLVLVLASAYDPSHGPWFSALALVILALDGLDGFVARRRSEASPFGARLDMETDALFVLTCAVLPYAHGHLGPFVLVAGWLRYLSELVRTLFLRNVPDAPRSRFGRHVYAIVVIALVISLGPLVPWHGPLATAATLLLVISFARSWLWSLRHRERSSAPADTSPGAPS